jgi:hypothetical protein
MQKMKLLPIAVCGTAAVTAETYLFQLILKHPASNPVQDVNELLVKFALLAGLPFLILLVIVLMRRASAFKFAMIAAMLGVLACILAYVQYSHSTPGFLVLGYLAQWITVIVTWFRIQQRNL